jgi:hypothetical protein
LTIWPTRTIPPTSPADRSAELEDAHERARFLDAVDARNATQRERERRERRNDEPQRPPPPPLVPPAPPPQADRPPPQRPPPPRQPPRLTARVPEAMARDLLDVGRAPPRRPSSGPAVTGASALSAPPSYFNARPQSARLSDAVPAEARARIDEFLKTGRLDTRPFSFSPIDALSEPRPRGAPLDPPPAEPQPIGQPFPATEPQPPKTGLENRLPFEFAAPMDLPGNRFDLLPVSLSAVQLGSSNR